MEAEATYDKPFGTATAGTAGSEDDRSTRQLHDQADGGGVDERLMQALSDRYGEVTQSLRCEQCTRFCKEHACPFMCVGRPVCFIGGKTSV